MTIPKNSKFVISLIFMSFLLISCGHKKSPTGGKRDTIKPEIVAIAPSEYSDIAEQDIEITFSKPMERSSLFSGLYIYPAINKKKFKWDKNTLKIEINEQLEQGNYYFSFTTNIKGEHGNALNKNQIFVFANGKLSDQRIAGNFSYEVAEDNILPVEMKLMTADSTLIYLKSIESDSFLLEDLNQQDHILEFFIDKNKNSRYDYGKEPYFYEYILQNFAQTLSVEMAYADTIKPELKSIIVSSNKQLKIVFSESIQNLDNVQIFTDDSLRISKNIIGYSIWKDEINIITVPLDSIRYSIEFNGLTDKKNNETNIEKLFDGKTLKDTIPPEIIYTSIRNGATINNLKPEIKFQFSELIFSENVQAKLTEEETGIEHTLEVTLNISGKISIMPVDQLHNMSSYKLNINCGDNSNNYLKKAEEILFIPIIVE